MKRTLFILLMLLCSTVVVQGQSKHLFILSGQSNMARLDPGDSFTPAIEVVFKEADIVVVKDAKSGEPIRRWYKAWSAANGDQAEGSGDLYGRLMEKVHNAFMGDPFQTVTFIWMQGERDAREGHGEVYATSLQGLFDQLSTDLGRQDINFVIGRLSDFDMDNARYPHWTMVRDAQVEVAEECERCVWVNTDDLNDGLNNAGKEISNDLHYSVTGYKVLGERFAQAALGLIN